MEAYELLLILVEEPINKSETIDADITDIKRCILVGTNKKSPPEQREQDPSIREIGQPMVDAAR